MPIKCTINQATIKSMGDAEGKEIASLILGFPRIGAWGLNRDFDFSTLFQVPTWASIKTLQGNVFTSLITTRHFWQRYHIIMSLIGSTKEFEVKGIAEKETENKKLLDMAIKGIIDGRRWAGNVWAGSSAITWPAPVKIVVRDSWDIKSRQAARPPAAEGVTKARNFIDSLLFHVSIFPIPCHDFQKYKSKNLCYFRMVAL